MSHKILFVDDEPNVTNALKHTLRKERYDILTANSVKVALEILSRNAVDVVIADEKMPGMPGSEMLALVRRKYPDTVRIILTVEASLDVAIRAINEGEIYRFLIKPCNGPELAVTIRKALEHRKLMVSSRKLLKNASQQTALLQQLEEKQPGITKIEKNSDGFIVIEEPTDDGDLLMKQIDKEIEDSSKLFLDWTVPDNHKG